jgi:hypothetical protein
MNKVFIGYDHRQPISYNVLQYSIISTAKQPVEITPLVLPQLPINRQGLTPFTYSRFLVPYLCDYKGWALFLDADMLVVSDIGELFSLADESKAIMVVQNEKRFEWASVMLFNCQRCQFLSVENIEKANDLHRLTWLDDDRIGTLPSEWNHLVGYDPERKDVKLIHYTQGIPAFPETIKSEHSEIWGKVARESMSARPWAELMGNSVHAVELSDGSKVPRLTFGEKRIAEMIRAQANA